MMTDIATRNQIQRHVEIDLFKHQQSMIPKRYPGCTDTPYIHTHPYIRIFVYFGMDVYSCSLVSPPSHPNRFPPECQPVDAQDIDAKLCQFVMVKLDCASADPTATGLGSPWPWDGKPSFEIGAKTPDISLIALFIFRISKLQRARFAACTSCSRCQSNQAGTSSWVIWSEQKFQQCCTASSRCQRKSCVDCRIFGGPSSIICYRLALDLPVVLPICKTESPSMSKPRNESIMMIFDGHCRIVIHHVFADISQQYSPRILVFVLPIFQFVSLYFMMNKLNPQSAKLQETLKPSDLKHTFVIGEPKATRRWWVAVCEVVATCEKRSKVYLYSTVNQLTLPETHVSPKNGWLEY